MSNILMYIIASENLIQSKDMNIQSNSFSNMNILHDLNSKIELVNTLKELYYKQLLNDNQKLLLKTNLQTIIQYCLDAIHIVKNKLKTLKNKPISEKNILVNTEQNIFINNEQNIFINNEQNILINNENNIFINIENNILITCDLLPYIKLQNSLKLILSISRATLFNLEMNQVNCDNTNICFSLDCQKVYENCFAKSNNPNIISNSD